jgi:hypothetical protein
MRVTTRTVGSTTTLRSVSFESLVLDCDDGTRLQYSWGIGWGSGLPMPARRVDWDDVWWGDAAHLHGRLGVHGGSGTFSEAVPALAADETAAQLCATGDLTWQVQRVEGEGSLRPTEVRTLISTRSQGATRTVVTSEPRGTVRTMVTSEPQGTVRSVVTSEARTAAGTARFRNYRGRTSQGEPMGARTAKVDSTIELRRLEVAFGLTCEDSTEVGWGATWLFGPGWTLPQARLDYDDVQTGEAMHVHGRLGAHDGSGTLTDVLAALTNNEQAQLCTTGELTWRLWRIDAGARLVVP